MDSRVSGRQLIEFIESNGLQTGDRLPSIRELSLLLNEPPNAVRDALLAAQTKGIVKIHPRAGAFVQSLDFSSLVEALSESLGAALTQKDPDLLDLIEARNLIETETAGLMASRRQGEDLLPLYRAMEEMKELQEDRQAFIRVDEQFHLSIASASGNRVLVIMLQSLLVLLRPYRINLLFQPDSSNTQITHEQIYQCLKFGDVEGAKAAMQAHVAYSRENLLSRL